MGTRGGPPSSSSAGASAWPLQVRSSRASCPSLRTNAKIKNNHATKRAKAGPSADGLAVGGLRARRTTPLVRRSGTPAPEAARRLGAGDGAQRTALGKRSDQVELFCRAGRRSARLAHEGPKRGSGQVRWSRVKPRHVGSNPVKSGRVGRPIGPIGSSRLGVAHRRNGPGHTTDTLRAALGVGCLWRNILLLLLEYSRKCLGSVTKCLNSVSKMSHVSQSVSRVSTFLKSKHLSKTRHFFQKQALFKKQPLSICTGCQLRQVDTNAGVATTD